MRRRYFHVLLLATVLCVLLSAPASATAVFVDGVSTLTGWYDVNKSNVYGSDSLMCWAASASNVLAYTEWYGWNGSSLIDTAPAIYSYFTSDWSNAIGAPFYGYEWWLTSRTTSIVNPGKTLDGGGLGFYPTVPVNTPIADPNTVTFYSNSPGEAIPFYIGESDGISLSITITVPGGGGTFGHSLTLWGYDPDNQWLWVTDSDDGGLPTLTKYSYSVSGSVWTILNYTNLYTVGVDVPITQVTRLDPNSDHLLPEGAGGGTVPDPASSVLLLGISLSGLLVARKKARKD